MVWRIEYTATARNGLRKLDRQTTRHVINYLEKRVGLLDSPRSAGKELTGPLGGLWRYRVGDCRVICDIQDDTLRVLVIKIGHRREV